MTTMLRRAQRVINVALVFLSLLGIVGLVLAIGLHAAGYRLLTVQTASMTPVFHPGDALISQPPTKKPPAIGQIISYRRPDNQTVIVSHRLVARTTQGWLITAGDALHSRDPAFPPRQMIGQPRFVLPKLGRLLDDLHRPLVAVCLIYLPASGWLIMEFWRFDQFRSSRRYRHSEYRR